MMRATVKRDLAVTRRNALPRWWVAAMACVFALAALPAPAAGKPDLSGFWNLAGGVPKDKVLLGKLPPNTVILEDTGAAEFPAGEFGGLKVKPHALEAAKRWNPRDDMKLSNACKPPSIVYAMQGPFPIEIFQGTEFIIIKLEYFDLVRIVFMDGRPQPGPDYPLSKVGFSTGRWEGDTLVVETTHLEPATITNNGLTHSDKVRVIERFRLSADGNTLMATQEFEDPEVLDNRGARFIAWKRQPGEHVYPYECDPTFALEYQKG
ncbi:MAG: hypothetical protein IRZ28_16415 [Steroidobacteraceae bacterium]|nr:hypothetical protein [Steroidobacteraceae bacterium]